MNLKEKWTKQNNSVKMLLRKLKRHDTVVVAASVVIAVLLCGGLIYLSTPVVAASAKDELVEVQERDNEQTIEKLDELSEYLNGLDKSITESRESINNLYEKDGADKLTSEKNTEKMTNTVTEKVGSLGKEFSSIHDTISKTETDIERLKELIEKGDADAGKAINESFINIYKNLEEIENTYNKSQESTKELMEQIRNAMKNGDDRLSKELLDSYQELLDKLGESDNRQADQNSETLQSFKTEITNLNQLISERLKEMSSEMNSQVKELDSNMSKGLDGLNSSMSKGLDGINSSMNKGIDGLNADMSKGLNGLNSDMTKGLDGLNSSMNNGVTTINSSMDNHFTSLSQSFEGDMSELKGYLEGELTGVNSKLEKVFQLVSNGKKLLASTLLTKGVEIKEDATFAEIAKAIEDIPVKIVLDQDDIPGKVVYQYHYHVDGQGHECDEEYVPIDRMGGCYTAEYVHTHNDDCYEVTVKYTYSTSKDVENRGFSHDDWEGNHNYHYYCDYCKKKFINDNPQHAESTTSEAVADRRSEGSRRKKVTKTLVCTKPEGELLGYQTTCNLVHGQIVAAKIVFSEDYDKYNTTTGVIAPSNPDVTTSLMRGPATDSSISAPVLWDEDLDWNFAPEDDDNSFGKEKSERADAPASEPAGRDGASDKQSNNNNENGDNNNEKEENVDNVDDTSGGTDNADTDSSNDEPSDEHNDGDVSQTDDVVMENTDTQNTSDNDG